MKSLYYCIAALFIIGCTSNEQSINELSSAQQREGWKLLFDGKSLNGWHLYNLGDTSSKWTVKDGELICDPRKPDGVFADLVSDSSYHDFELLFDWKVAKGGNSGVFINVEEDAKYAATFATGLEMQLLDNAHAEERHKKDSTHWAGCLYGVDCKGANSKPNPHNSWNTSRIKQQDGIVSFWLNDKLTFTSDINSATFKQQVADSHMKAYPDFATYSNGKIALQNHTDSIAFRNIFIKPL